MEDELLRAPDGERGDEDLAAVVERAAERLAEALEERHGGRRVEPGEQSVRRAEREIQRRPARVGGVAPEVLGTNGLIKAGAMLVFATIGLSMVVLSGWAGQVSVGQMAFVGLGGAVAAWAIVERGYDPVLAMGMAGLAGAALAIVIGIPALRLRGLNLAVVTLGLAVAASNALFSNELWRWIPTGVFDRPKLLGRFDVDSPGRLYYLSLVVLVISVVAVRGLRRSRFGRVLVAQRDNEVAVSSFGANVVTAKLASFAVSGFIAAVAGAVFVLHQAAFRDENYDVGFGISVFVAAVIGGLGSAIAEADRLPRLEEHRLRHLILERRLVEQCAQVRVVGTLQRSVVIECPRHRCFDREAGVEAGRPGVAEGVGTCPDGVAVYWRELVPQEVEGRRHLAEDNGTIADSAGLSAGAVAAVAGGVAAGAAELGFLDERAFGVVEVGNVVVFEEVGAAAVDAALVAFFDHEFLSFGVVAVPSGDVDGVALGVVDHRPECRGVGDALDDRAADGGAVVEGAAVGSDVEDDLGDHVGAAGADDVDEGVDPLLGQ